MAGAGVGVGAGERIVVWSKRSEAWRQVTNESRWAAFTSRKGMLAIRTPVFVPRPPTPRCVTTPKARVSATTERTSSAQSRPLVQVPAARVARLLDTANRRSTRTAPRRPARWGVEFTRLYDSVKTGW